MSRRDVLIPPFVDAGGDPVVVSVSVGLVNAFGVPVAGYTTTESVLDAAVVTTDDTGATLSLVPQSEIYGETWWKIDLTSTRLHVSHCIQVPDGASPIPLVDLINLALLVNPADPFSERLLPSPDGAADGLVAVTQSGAWTLAAAPSGSGSGVPDALLTGGPYGRQTGAWVAVATAAQGTLAESAVQPGDPVSDLIETVSAKILTGDERVKLTGIAEGATANATDAALRDRTTHTGTQAISTVTGLQTALDTKSDSGHAHTGVYATSAQGGLADAAVQPGDDAADLGSGAAADGLVLTADGAGGAAWEAVPAAGGVVWGSITGTIAAQTDLTPAAIGAATSAQGAKADTALQPTTDVAVGQLTATKTTEQLRLAYDATHYVSFTVDADGFAGVSGGLAETPVVANTGTAYTVSGKSLHDLTLTGNCVFTFPTPTAGRQFTMILNQDATGNRTATWPASVRWAGGTAPTITVTASKTDVFSFLAVGTYWLGFTGGQVFTRA